MSSNQERRKEVKKLTGFGSMSPYMYPFYTILHPKDGFQEMKYNKKGTASVTFYIVLAWLFVEMFYRKAADFDMNPFDQDSLSLLRVSLITVAMYVMVCVANWCFCTLLDGKGKMKEICAVAAYALVPYIIVRFIMVLMSHVLAGGSESIILTYAVTLSQLWGALMAFIGLSVIHEYSFKKTLLSVILTLVGLIIMLFISVLFLILWQQLYNFVVTIAFELMY